MGNMGSLNNVDVQVFGAGNVLSPGTSAYVMSENEAPSFVAFGVATEPFGHPANMEIVPLS